MYVEQEKGSGRGREGERGGGEGEYRGRGRYPEVSIALKAVHLAARTPACALIFCPSPNMISVSQHNSESN